MAVVLGTLHATSVVVEGSFVRRRRRQLGRGLGVSMVVVEAHTCAVALGQVI